MDHRPVPVAVEYDAAGHRVRKVFSDAFQARRFYAAMMKRERSPQVKRSDTMCPEIIEPTTATAETPTVPAAPKAKKAKKAEAKAKKAKPEAKKAKAKVKRQPTGNLKFKDAQLAVLKILAGGGEVDRNALKAKAPYGSYTGLMRKTVEAGLAREKKYDGQKKLCYEITAAGRKAVSK